jgi:hypothetical protein
MAGCQQALVVTEVTQAGLANRAAGAYHSAPCRPASMSRQRAGYADPTGYA